MTGARSTSLNAGTLASARHEALNEHQQRALERCRERLGLESSPEDMPWLVMLARHPAFLKDAAMNLERSVLQPGALDRGRKCLIASALAATAGQRDFANFFGARAHEEGYEEARIRDAISVLASARGFNEYFRFRSLAGGDAFASFHAGLGANALMHHNLGRGLAELLQVVAAATNGCASCVRVHVEKAEACGVSVAEIDEAMRVSAVVHSICAFLGAFSPNGDDPG